MMFAYNVPGVDAGNCAQRDQHLRGDRRPQGDHHEHGSARKPVMLRDEAYVQMAISRAEGAGRFGPRDILSKWGISGEPCWRAKSSISAACTLPDRNHACACRLSGSGRRLYKAVRWYVGLRVGAVRPASARPHDDQPAYHRIARRSYETAGKVLLGLGLREPMF